MMLWRTPRLISRAFTSETVQDWATSTMFTVGPDTGANKGKGSASTPCDSPRQSIQGTFSIANRVSADAPVYTMDIQRPMSPINEPRIRGLTDVLSSGDKEQPETMPRRSESEGASAGGEQGTIAVAVDQAPILVDGHIQARQEITQTSDSSPRTLKTKNKMTNLASARDRAANGNSMGEPQSRPGDASGAPVLPKFTFSQSGEPIELSSSERRASPSADDALPWTSGPLYFRQQRAPNGDGRASITNLDHAESERPIGDEAIAWIKRGFDVQPSAGRGVGRHTSVIAARTTQMIPELAEMQKDGLPTVDATDTFEFFGGVTDRNNLRESPRTAMGEATEAAETPVPGNSISDVKEGAQVSNAKYNTSPRKISFLDKIRGEMKVLSGKLGNNQDKIKEGKKMMGKAV